MHENGSFWPTVILIGTTLTSAALAAALHRLRLPALPSLVLGGVAPAAIIIVAALILESRTPLDGVGLLFAFILAGATLIFGIPAAAFAIILSTQLRGDPEDVS